MANKHGFTHFIKCVKCNLPGMCLKHMPKVGSPMLAEFIYFEDGTSPKQGDLARCQHCGFGLSRSIKAIYPISEAD